VVRNRQALTQQADLREVRGVRLDPPTLAELTAHPFGTTERRPGGNTST
jgi:hypothetical protein